MNPKINKDYDSSEFVNKIVFFLLVVLIIFIVLGDMYLMKDNTGTGIKYKELQIGLVSYPWLTAGSVMIYDVIANETSPITLTKYLPASLSILFASIVFFIFIPFTLIFSVSPAIKLFQKKKIFLNY